MKAKSITLNQIEQLLLTYEETIPDTYLDEMGHMNVMWYTHLFSQAMRGTFRYVGIDPDYMEANQPGTFALESHVHYLSEVRVGQRVAVYSRVISRSSKRIHVMHFMINRDKQDLAAIFEAVSTHTDMSVRRSSPLPAFAVERIDQLIAEQTGLGWEAPVCGVIRS